MIPYELNHYFTKPLAYLFLPLFAHYLAANEKQNCLYLFKAYSI